MERPIDVAHTLCARDYKGWTDRKSQNNGVVYKKNVQIIDPQGRKSKEVKPRDECPTLRAQTHGNVPMVVGGIYLQATEDYQRGILPEMSRTIKAVQHDAGVVINEQVRRDADG